MIPWPHLHTNSLKKMKDTPIALVASAVLTCGSIHAGLVGYWSFDSYTPGPNPAGLPQSGGDAGEGYFDDLSGNDQKAYGADFSSIRQAPFQADAGKFGGAFYSENTGNNGALAVVQHTDTINFDAEDFTISFWEKSQFRDVTGNGWAAGRGRSQWFAKAPYITDGTVEGYGLNLTQNHFDLLTNNSDNFGQTSLGARFTFPSGTTPAYDSGVWAHWAITGAYNAGSDDYSITVYLNGVAVDWNGATGTTLVVANDIIDNPGDLTIGSFYRNNGYATQRFISWNMMDGSPEQGNGKGWLDDFAMWDEVLNATDLAALAAGTAQPPDVGSDSTRPVLEIAPDGANLDFTWDSKAGKVYDLLSARDLKTTPDTWTPWQSEIPATPPSNTNSYPRPADPDTFFVLVEKPAPPVLSEDFEADAGGFTAVNHSAGTTWVIGEPDSTGDGGSVTTGNDGSARCWGTDIGNPGIYLAGTDTSLISPVIDLTEAAGATLTFAQAIDILEGDTLVVNIIDDTSNDVIVPAIHTSTPDGEISAADWETVGSVAIGGAALGQKVRIEWRFTGDNDGSYLGAYIDDVEVSVQ